MSGSFGLILLAALVTSTPPIRFEQYALGNGLRVFLVEDHTVPVVTVDVWYHVGSRNEERGRTGLARLVQRLMFRSSEHLAPGQQYSLVEGAGGELTANTSEDRTAFSETLPSEQLALGLWLEADRMRSFKVTEEAFGAERESVGQERQMRVEGQPYGAAFLDGIPGSFDSTACFSYSHSVLGSPEDLGSAQPSDVEAFFKLFFAPNQATLVVTGDLDAPQTKRLIETYFGDIPRGATPPEVHCDARYSGGERTQRWPDALANLPAVMVNYRIPPHADADAPALDLLGTIIGQGDNSRVSRSLKQEKKAAVQAGAGVESRGGPGALYLYAIAAPGTELEVARAAVIAEVAKLPESVTGTDLEKAKAQQRTGAMLARQTTYQLAEEFEHLAQFHPPGDGVDVDLDRYRAVTIDDVRRVARKYLTPANSSTILVLPMGGRPAPANGAPREE
jgi:predicted Zn-dependent peptidase